MSPPPRFDSPDALYHWYLGQVETEQAVEFDSLLEAHPEWREDLTELEHARLVFERLGPRLGFSFSTEITSALSAGDDADVDPDPLSWAGPTSRKLLQRLRERTPEAPRYRRGARIGQGGMGEVFEAWDEDLRRRVATKRLRPDVLGSRGATAARQRLLDRFLEEAQVTSQLEHPGIVPVHDLGMDQDGGVYFAMTHVRGGDLRDVFARRGTEEGEWSQPRVLGVLVKVCEAMAYAHAKGVIHRDLKPANIMIGRFGQVYVMDWGLARVLGQSGADSQPPGGLVKTQRSPSLVESDREENRRAGSDHTATGFGTVLGTPCYMSPEQAAAEFERVDRRSDVYSLGAILYELITGRAPHDKGRHVERQTIVAMILMGPPDPVSSLAPECPPELEAICEKAMAREPEARYQDMELLLSDLRAYLEGRVVAAYEAGPVAELHKWTRRNRPLAAAIATAVLVLVAATALSLSLYTRAQSNAREARSAQRKVQDLAAGTELATLEREWDGLWPIAPGSRGAILDWIERAEGFRELMQPSSGGGGILADLEQLMQQQASGSGRSGDPAFDRWLAGQARSLTENAKEFLDPVSGAIEGESYRGLPGAKRRLERIESLREASLDSPEAIERWRTARASVRTSPLYSGLTIEPQFGLLPLRENAQGCYEFAHLPSGEPPEIGPDGEYVIEDGTGIVLVLIPGGNTYLPEPSDSEPALEIGGVPHRRAVSEPFFCSKYETTQGQWLKVHGSDPSELFEVAYQPQQIEDFGLTRPVQMVSYSTCLEAGLRLQLRLPSDIEWHRAARADTQTLYISGDDLETFAQFANFLDRTGRNAAFGRGRELESESVDDGFDYPARVGSLLPNRWGLHDVYGNVWEWTASKSLDADDPEDVEYTCCGGCFASPAGTLAPHQLRGRPARSFDHRLGVRFVRSLAEGERP